MLFFDTEIHLKVIRDVIIVYIYAPSEFLKGACLFIPQNEVLAADYGTHFYYFFSATTDEPTCVVLVVVEPPFLRQRTNNLRGGPRGPCGHQQTLVADIERLGDGSDCPCDQQVGKSTEWNIERRIIPQTGVKNTRVNVP